MDYTTVPPWYFLDSSIAFDTMITIIEHANDTIQTVPRPLCPVCSGPGTVIYRDLKDRLFTTPGLWSVKECSLPSCGTLWLDPTPEEKDLHKLYANYSTHKESAPTAVNTKKRSVLDKVRESYLFEQYGYGKAPQTFVDTMIGTLASLHPAWKDTQAANVFYIPFKAGGTLLDVGCGSGSAMETMQEKGWSVIGTDFDETAIGLAQRKGLDARMGDIESQNFPNNNFDAILLNHVIEHIPHPLQMFKECYRILKPGGMLVMITPNGGSRGRMFYGRNWRGLETPHHLQLFTPGSLAALGKKAGFQSVKGFSSLQGVFYILGQSRELTKKDTIDPYSSSFTNAFIYKPLIKQIRWFILGWIHTLLPGRDEVAVVVCRKKLHSE